MTDSNPPADESVAPEASPMVATADAMPQAPAAKRRRVRTGVLVAILVPLVVVGSVAGWAAINRQYLEDQWAVWNYESTAAIEEYTDDSTMTEHALFLFEASKPRIAPDSEFNSICGSKEGGDGALGCYTLDDKRITLFEISDDRISGLQEVVSSHEMLHAAWDRFGDGERDRIAALIDTELERLTKDEAFQERLTVYRFSDDDDDLRYDELHAIIGTEVAGISAELEEHYTTYFTDRPELVSIYHTANDVLIEIAQKVTTLNEELDALETKIDAAVDEYEAGYEQLNADVDIFNARADGYYYRSQSAFDADRAALIARGDALDALYDSTDVLIDEYNEKLEELLDLDEDAADLFLSINLDPRSAGL